MAGAFYRALEQRRGGKRSFYGSQRNALWSERSGLDSHWQEIADFIWPTKTRFTITNRNQYGKRNQNIIDSTGTLAARTLGSGFQAGMSSSARPWFKLGTPDPALSRHKPVAEWLEEVTRRMLIVFADTNFYLGCPQLYEDVGTFGTGAVSILPDDEDVFRVFNYPIGSYAVALDKRGRVNTFVHEYEMTVAQVVEEFGVEQGYRDIQWTNISRAVKALWEQGNYHAPVPVCWTVMPNMGREYTADGPVAGPAGMPFSSCTFETGEDRDAVFLRESGYETFPVMVPRWRVTGNDSYGNDCCGMAALGDVKQLQMMQKDKARALKKMIDPPVQGPPELRNQKTSLLPGDINYVRDSREGGGLRTVHEVSIDYGALLEDLRDLRFIIQRNFYEDLFLLVTRSDDRLGAQRPTAREIDERHEEKLIALGPTLERMGDEFHDRAIDNAFLRMSKAGLIPPPPEELDGVPLQVEYISILAQAQKQFGIIAQDRFLASTANVAAIYPEARHKVKALEAVDRYAEFYGVDPAITRSNDEAQQLADAEAQQQAAAASAQQAALLAKAGKDASTPIGRGSPLELIGRGAA